jgi:tricorn protease
MEQQSLHVGAGDIITSINGQAIPEAGGIARLRDINAGRQVVVGLADGTTDKERFIEVKPIGWLSELILASNNLHGLMLSVRLWLT